MFPGLGTCHAAYPGGIHIRKPARNPALPARDPLSRLPPGEAKASRKLEPAPLEVAGLGGAILLEQAEADVDLKV